MIAPSNPSGSAETLALSRVPWDLFGTLTFKGAIPSQKVRSSMWFAFTRQVERSLHLPEGRSLWLLRSERGEQGSRLHLHFLWAGLPARYVNDRTCLVVMALAEGRGFGIARVRRVDSDLAGVDYVLKGLSGRDAYEGSRFASNDEGRVVTFSHSLAARLTRPRLRRWSAFKGNATETRTLATRSAQQTAMVGS